MNVFARHMDKYKYAKSQNVYIYILYNFINKTQAACGSCHSQDVVCEPLATPAIEDNIFESKTYWFYILLLFNFVFD